MKKGILLGFVLIFMLLMGGQVRAEVPSLNESLEAAGITQLENKTKEITQDSESEILQDFDFIDIIQKFLTGNMNISLTGMISYVLRLLFHEVFTLFGLIQKLVLIAVLSAVLKAMNGSFQNKAVGELSFYVCYIVLVFLVMSSFATGVRLVADTTGKMSESMEALLPVFSALMVTSGDVTLLGIAGPIVTAAAAILTVLITAAVLPAITLVTTLEMLNNISEKSLLSQFTELMKSIIGWGLKGSAVSFMMILSVARLASPALGKVLGKTARAAVSAVPVVGNLMTGAVEAAAAFAGALKNGMAAAAILFLVFICLLPFLKLLAMIFLYKITAALVEPMCESRIVKCLSAAGDFSVLLLGALFTVEIMFLFSVIILLSTA